MHLAAPEHLLHSLRSSLPFTYTSYMSALFRAALVGCSAITLCPHVTSLNTRPLIHRRLFGYGQQQGPAAAGSGGAAGSPVEVEMHGGGGGGMAALMQRPPLRGPFAEKVGLGVGASYGSGHSLGRLV